MGFEWSSIWFVGLAGAVCAAYVLGKAVSRCSTSWAEILLVVVTMLSLAWSARSGAQDAILRLVPLDALVYLEGTAIAPVFALVAGVIAGRRNKGRLKRLGPILGAFALAYLAFNGAWMVTPRVEMGQPTAFSSVWNLRVVPQSRDETCVAAALATALRAPGINVRVSEGEMARLADVRVGRGATMLRGLRGAQRRLKDTNVEAHIVGMSADEVVQAATQERPALVTLRSGFTMTHMVAVLGLDSPTGYVLIANPSMESEIGAQAFGYERGVQLLPMERFRQLYMGSAIVFSDRAKASASANVAL